MFFILTLNVIMSYYYCYVLFIYPSVLLSSNREQRVALTFCLGDSVTNCGSDVMHTVLGKYQGQAERGHKHKWSKLRPDYHSSMFVTCVSITEPFHLDVLGKIIFDHSATANISESSAQKSFYLQIGTLNLLQSKHSNHVFCSYDEHFAGVSAQVKWVSGPCCRKRNGNLFVIRYLPVICPLYWCKGICPLLLVNVALCGEQIGQHSCQFIIVMNYLNIQYKITSSWDFTSVDIV